MSTNVKIIKKFRNGYVKTYEVPEGMTDVQYIAARCAWDIRDEAEEHMRHVKAEGEEAFKKAVEEDIARIVYDIEWYGVWDDGTGIWYTARKCA